MNKQNIITMITIGIMALMITFVGAVDMAGIIAGNNHTFQVDTTHTLYWDVIGNSSNMDGFNITQDKYSNYSNITIVTHPLFKSDNFIITLFDREKEIVIEHHYSGGGGGCAYNPDYDWRCSEWTACDDNMKTRTCEKKNNCGNTYGRPNVTTFCEDEYKWDGEVIKGIDITPGPEGNDTIVPPTDKPNNTILFIISFGLGLLVLIILLILLFKKKDMEKENEQ